MKELTNISKSSDTSKRTNLAREEYLAQYESYLLNSGFVEPNKTYDALDVLDTLHRRKQDSDSRRMAISWSKKLADHARRNHMNIDPQSLLYAAGVIKSEEQLRPKLDVRYENVETMRDHLLQKQYVIYKQLGAAGRAEFCEQALDAYEIFVNVCMEKYADSLYLPGEKREKLTWDVYKRRHLARRHGVERPWDQALAHMYQITAAALKEIGQADRALRICERGAARLGPSGYSLSLLYEAAELALSRQDRFGAVKLLKQIVSEPISKNVVLLQVENERGDLSKSVDSIYKLAVLQLDKIRKV